VPYSFSITVRYVGLSLVHAAGEGETHFRFKIIVDNRGTYFMLRLGRASALTATRRVQSSFPGLSASKVVDRRARKKTAKQIICAI
jgi:hypothetical protein